MPKRPNGDGGIRLRADGRWEGMFVEQTPGGGVARRSIYGKSHDDVARRLRASVTARDCGLVMPSGKETLAKFLDTWLKGCEGTLRPQTWSTYERHIRLHVLPTLGALRLSQLQPQHLQRLYHARMAAGLSPTTVHHIHAILHKALKQAVRWNLVPRNVADLVDAPRIAKHEMRVFDAAGVRQLLAAAAGDRLEALYILAVTTGMRRGELLALRWRDVDQGRAVLSVTGSLQRTKVGLVIGAPKTSGSRRQVSLSVLAVAALARHSSRQAAEQLRAGPEWVDLGMVFANEIGRPIEPGNMLRRSFEPLLLRAKLPRLRFHDLRHTAATLMLSGGVHPKVASEMLGHSTIAITLDLYSHVSATMQQSAASAMDLALGAPS